MTTIPRLTLTMAPVGVLAALIAVPSAIRPSTQDLPLGCNLVASVAGSSKIPSIHAGRGKVADYITGDTTDGCEVRLRGPATLFDTLAVPTDYFKGRFRNLGWTEDLRYAADGPTETGFALRRGQEMCLFHGSWDGEFVMVVQCAVQAGSARRGTTAGGPQRQEAPLRTHLRRA